MKIFDVHVHANNTIATPKELLSNLDKAGVYGCCVFSNMPKEDNGKLGTSFEERLQEVLNWQKGYEDRIFPVLWIHPYEENAIEKVKIAVDNGIVAFKIICNNFYVYEDKCIDLLKEIAKYDKPVFFHSGILWDGSVSSTYNRPLNFESLINIEGLRFSMGHCSWPWIDECIALYGKFLNALQTKNTAEMFFDLTPGTPEIYRKELLTKLYTIGYDVGNNVFFGTDASAESYSHTWCKKWLDVDGKILNELGVSKENLEKIYYKNLMRFLGKEKVEIKLQTPSCDDANEWSPVSKDVEKIIEKWYKKLEFPKEYDSEFYKYLSSVKISDAITIDSYDLNCQDGTRNLLSYLYLCESTSKIYSELGISEEILVDTLKDIVTWTKTYSNIKNYLYLGEIGWLSRHLKGKIFKLGRLQFCLGTNHGESKEDNLFNGDNVIEIHIPEGEKLTIEESKKSLDMARAFFEKFFPSYKYEYFTCHSWLLDDTLKKYLNENSNILKFASMFKIIDKNESYNLIKYIFTWDTTVINLPYKLSASNFANNVKSAVLKGETFYEKLGIIKK